MKTIFTILCTFLSLSFAYAQSVSATIKGNYSFNGSSFRITTVYDGNKTAYELTSMHEGKEYITRIIPQIENASIRVVSTSADGQQNTHVFQASEMAVQDGISMDGLSARKTGVSKNIAGMNCSQILIQTKNGTQAELWIYENGFPLSAYKEIYKSDYAVQALALLQLSGIAMEMHVTNPNGNTILTFSTREYLPQAEKSIFQ